MFVVRGSFPGHTVWYLSFLLYLILLFGFFRTRVESFEIALFYFCTCLFISFLVPMIFVIVRSLVVHIIRSLCIEMLETAGFVWAVYK